jgi:AhpD family alkylhydroperoxidase
MRGGIVSQRWDYKNDAPGVYKAMSGFEAYLRTCSLEHNLRFLVMLRASQVNGCAYCIDMHWKDLRAVGEEEKRLYSLDAWRDCPYYTDRERAALEWTEAVTLVADARVPDSVYDSVRKHFTMKELADLTLAVVAINGWNRLLISARREPGDYQPETVHSRNLSRVN